MKSRAQEKVIGARIPDVRTVLLDVVLRFRFKRKAGKDVNERGLRKTAASFAKSMEGAHTPPFVGVTRVEINGRTAESVTATDVTATEGEPEKVILYFHGGGFFMSSPKDHRPIIWRMARATNRRVLAVDYRKAPDHAFPAWLDDAFATYQYALAQGIAAKDIVLSGDSAGGNIALALTHRIRREGLPMPEALVLFSPWADLECKGRTYRTKKRRDAMFHGEGARNMGKFLTRGIDARDPEVSPINGDFTGFPRMLVFAGSTEIFLDDARAVVRKAGAAGVDARLFVMRHMPHVFPIFAKEVPRAKVAYEIVKSFVAESAGATVASGAAKETAARAASPTRSAVAAVGRA
jgi:monoterpene epsilon-lactone hydrolase